MKNRLSFWYSFLFLVFGVAGYYREYFFVHLNNIMFQKYYSTTSELVTPSALRFFYNYNYNTLYYSKYFFTTLSFLLFFSLNFFAVKKLINISIFNKAVIVAYILMLMTAAFSMLIGYFVNHRLQNDEYTLSRWLMGIAQSPIICLILVASQKLYIKSQTYDKERHHRF